MTPFCTSMTSSAVLGRFSSVVIVPPVTGDPWSRPRYAGPTTFFRSRPPPPFRGRPRSPLRPALVGAAEDEAFAVGGRPATPDAGPLLRLAVRGDDPRRG